MAQRIMDAYPAFTPLMKVPEIAKLLVEATEPKNQWSPQKFQARLMGTDWWKQHSTPAQSWIITQLVHPAEAARLQGQTSQAVHQIASQMGIVLSPTDLGTLVDNANRLGWNAGQIQQAVGSHAARKTLHAGTLQATADNLRKTGADYGLPLSPQSAFTWAQKIAEGTATQDGFNSYAQNQAKHLYPHLAQHIDEGMTVRQLADPYFQIAGQTLGLDPNSLELTDHKWSAALQSRDAKGNITGPMSLQDWQKHLMIDPAYGYDHSVNGRSAALQMAQGLAKTFGFAT
jgi:hypothetical protein